MQTGTAMDDTKKQKPDNPYDCFSENEIYQFYGETDEGIILQIKKRKEKNEALKKLLEHLNSTISTSKQKKDV
jgi:hypothetical protein